MNRLAHLVFRLRGALIRREIAALQRHQLKVRRELLGRPHVPSAHLVPGYPGDAVRRRRLDDAAVGALWFRVAALVVTFAAGVLFADIAIPSHASTAVPHACGTEYVTPQQ
jgi:hypothetical protein